MGPLRVFQFYLIATVLAILTMGLGSYVSKVGAGLACPDWPLCPLETEPFVVLEFSHRIVAFATFISGLAGFVTALKSPGFSGRRLAYLGFGALSIQVFMVGALIIFTALPPIMVAVHQAVASSVVALLAATAAATYYSSVHRKPKNRAEEGALHG